MLDRLSLIVDALIKRHLHHNVVVCDHIRQLQRCDLLVVLRLQSPALIGNGARRILAHRVDLALQGNHVAHKAELLALELSGDLLEVGLQLDLLLLELVNALLFELLVSLHTAKLSLFLFEDLVHDAEFLPLLLIVSVVDHRLAQRLGKLLGMVQVGTGRGSRSLGSLGWLRLGKGLLELRVFDLQSGEFILLSNGLLFDRALPVLERAHLRLEPLLKISHFDVQPLDLVIQLVNWPLEELGVFLLEFLDLGIDLFLLGILLLELLLQLSKLFFVGLGHWLGRGRWCLARSGWCAGSFACIGSCTRGGWCWLSLTIL